MVNKKNLFIIVASIVFFIIFLNDIILKQQKNSLMVYLLFCIMSIITFIIVLIFNHKFIKINESNFHKFYLVLCLVIGLIFIVIAPVFMGSDERTHFYRVYEISDGHFITKENKNGILATMPRSINKAYTGFDDENVSLKNSITYLDSIKRMKIPLNKKIRLNFCSCNETNYFGASLYSPFQYIPHLIGVVFGKIFDFGPYWLLMIGRLTNFICFAILSTVGIKFLPKFKFVAMLLLLNPVVLSGATTFSADGITNAVIFLYISYILYLINSKKIIKIKGKVLLFTLAIFIAFCKIVYLPVIGIIFFINNKQFKTKICSIRFKAMLVFISSICSFCWLYFAGKYLNNVHSIAKYQENFIIFHSFQYFIIFIRTYIFSFGEILQNIFFGNQLYHSQLKVYSIFSFSYVFIIVASIFTEKGSFNLKEIYKKFIIIIIFLIIILISCALFIQANNPSNKNGIILGIQARYFIPILLLSIPLLNIKKTICKKSTIFTMFMMMYFPVILTIIVRFI